MPIEVREMIIKTTVTQDSNSSPKSDLKDDKDANKELIKLCVEKVLEIIREKNGR
jgi:Family of unknown function (DUF5908)